MNTLNFTFNFNAPVGQNIAHVDTLEAHFDKDMTMQVVDTAALCREGVENGSEIHPERLARAIEGVQPYFWAQSAWAVVYCVWRDHLGLGDNMNEFERLVEALPLRAGVCSCPPGTVRKTVMRNDFMRYPLHRWPEGRASKLAQQLIEKLAEESTNRDAERP